jgi:predicted transcriptional regulator
MEAAGQAVALVTAEDGAVVGVLTRSSVLRVLEERVPQEIDTKS